MDAPAYEAFLRRLTRPGTLDLDLEVERCSLAGWCAAAAGIGTRHRRASARRAVSRVAAAPAAGGDAPSRLPACPGSRRGAPCCTCSAGRTPGAPTSWAGMSRASVATRIRRSSWTTSPCRADTRASSARAGRLRRPRRRFAERHVREPRAGRVRSCCTTATRSRSAASTWSSIVGSACGPRSGPMNARDHQSIGEVLATLRDEFPDITISKIRFLESQGLIDPERTPSGYRKFRDGDIARLRWILHQQKDNFLPLKVIKARLDEAGPDALPRRRRPGRGRGPRRTRRSPPAPAASAWRVRRRPRRRTRPQGEEGPGDGVEGDRPWPTPRRRPRPAHRVRVADAAARRRRRRRPGRARPSGASLTRAELATAAGPHDHAARPSSRSTGSWPRRPEAGDRVIFAEDALVVAKLAAEFAAHGIGPRHLRMFRSFAEREAGLYDQVIAPRLKRKNPEARARPARISSIWPGSAGRCARCSCGSATAGSAAATERAVGSPAVAGARCIVARGGGAE